RVGDGVEHRLRRDVGLRGMQRGGELDMIGVQLARVRDPFLDDPIRVRVAYLARRQLLNGRGEDADLHELRDEWLNAHAERYCICAERQAVEERLRPEPGAKSPTLREPQGRPERRRRASAEKAEKRDHDAANWNGARRP